MDLSCKWCGWREETYPESLIPKHFLFFFMSVPNNHVSGLLTHANFTLHHTKSHSNTRWTSSSVSPAPFMLPTFPVMPQGILLVKHQSVQAPAGMVRLWMHEMSRVFGDRLADPPHRVMFEHMLIEAVGRSVPARLSRMFDPSPYDIAIYSLLDGAFADEGFINVGWVVEPLAPRQYTCSHTPNAIQDGM